MKILNSYGEALKIPESKFSKIMAQALTHGWTGDELEQKLLDNSKTIGTIEDLECIRIAPNERVESRE